MQAVRWHAAGDVRLDEVELELPLGPGMVEAEVRHTGICGTDVHIYQWDEWAQKTIPVPMAVGHEYSGEIVEVGSEVRGVKAGDLVEAQTPGGLRILLVKALGDRRGSVEAAQALFDDRTPPPSRLEPAPRPLVKRPSELRPDAPWLDQLELPDLPVKWSQTLVDYLVFYRDDPRGRARRALSAKGRAAR